MEVETPRHNLLGTTIVDTELNEKVGKDEGILESLLQMLHCHFFSGHVHVMEKLTICKDKNAFEIPVFNKSCKPYSHSNKGDLTGSKSTNDYLFLIDVNDCNPISSEKQEEKLRIENCWSVFENIPALFL